MPLHTTEHEFLLVLLRERRAKSGMSQVELAERLGVTQQYVSKVEGGQRRLDVCEFYRWCEALGVSSREVYEEFSATLDGRRTLRDSWDT
jgi:transcriptional regulator with XRE-family HTH domain